MYKLCRFMAKLVETWQVFVHSQRKVDMAAIVGQSQCTSVVVQGTINMTH